MASISDEIRAPNRDRVGPRPRGWRHRLWHRRWLIVVTTALFCAASLAWSFLVAPVYQANAVVQVGPDVSAGSAVRDGPQPVDRLAPTTRAAITLLSSRLVVGQVVDDLGLAVNVTPHRLPFIGDLMARLYHPARPGAVARPWFGMDAYDWGGSRLDIVRLEVPQSLLGEHLALVAGHDHRFSLYRHDGTLLLHGRSGSLADGHGVGIEVATLIANPGTAYDVVRQPRPAAIARVQGRLSARAQGTPPGRINVHFQDTDPARAVAILTAIVRQFALRSARLATANTAQALKFVTDQLPGIHRQLAAAKAALADYRDKAPAITPQNKVMGLLGELAATETRLREIRLRRAGNAQLFTLPQPDHPDALAQQVAQLDARKAELTRRVDALPAVRQPLLHLMLDEQVDMRVQASMKARARQLKDFRDDAPDQVRVIGKASVDVAWPITPRRAFIVVVGTLLGLFLSVAWACMRRAHGRGVEDPRIFERLGLPVYASIPLSGHQRDIERRRSRDRRRAGSRLHVLALDEPCDVAVEAIRSLRTSVHFATLEADSNILMISGAGSNVGTSFVCANLALVIAKAGRRVLLVDADLHNGTLHHVMGDGPGGLSGVLRGQIRLEAAVQHTAVEGLDFIARGRVPADPARLLAQAGFAEALAVLSPRYDLLVIDAPPIVHHVDAAIIGRHAGTRLLVARFGAHRAPDLDLALQRFARQDMAIRAAIFNAVEMRAAGYYFHAAQGYRAASA